jgi:galactokinase
MKGRTVAWSAPGRVNLIGEHTDYNEGYVLPFALPRRTTVRASMVDSPSWTVRSTLVDEEVSFTLDDKVTGWASYVAGVVWVLREAGVDVPPAALTVTSDVPIGAGLSSSAALECATLGALLDLAGALPDWPLPRWPASAQRAENAYAGVPCGIMDQSASALCRDGHALFLDCRSGAVEHVPLPLAVLVIDTRAPHRHADNEYAARRATCEAAARTLGVPSLRHVNDLDAALAALPDDLTRRRVRHVVSENARVLETVHLLRTRPGAIGPLLSASHRSLRDDFEVSSPELDLAVATALAHGATGARMTGGGFGGCAIALTDDPRRVDAAVTEAFEQRGFARPAAFVATAGPGVAREAGET